MEQRNAELLALQPNEDDTVRMCGDCLLFPGQKARAYLPGPVFSLIEFDCGSRLWCGNDTFSIVK